MIHTQSIVSSAQSGGKNINFTIRIIWIAFVASLGTICLVSWLLAKSHSTQPPVLPPEILSAFAAVAVGASLLSLALNFGTSKARNSTSANAVHRCFVLYLVCFALNEFVGILGLVLAVQTKDFSASLPYFGASALLQAAAFPTIKRAGVAHT
jgi:F0F1-type ATP synthase membrane subunit c/vacuolar-type H+-ATPase subunit K